MVTLKRKDEIIGLPVINKRDGKRLGKIKEILYELGNKKILGIVVDRESILSSKYYIPVRAISVFGEFAVIVDSSKEQIEKNSSYLLSKNLEEISESLNIPVITEDGDEVGKVSNIIINEINGTVEAFEISKGFFDDLLKGRQTIKNTEKIQFGKDIIILKDNENNRKSRT